MHRSSSLDVPAGVTQEEDHTRFLIHLLSAMRALSRVTQDEDHTRFLIHLSAMRALIFLARRIQPFLSLVDREIDFCVLTI